MARGVRGVLYVQADMRAFSFTETFDRGLLLFSSFGYFEDAENFQVLENMARVIKPGGLFCIDVLNRDALLKHFLPFLVVEKGNDFMIDRNIFDSATGRLYTRRVIIRDGKRKDKPFSIRLYNPTEMRDLLNRAGFRISKIYGDWDAKPLTHDTPRMILIAQRE